MLREDVVEAVGSKQFHIWAAKTINEGIEILTGVPAGKRGRNGQFPEGTVAYRVDRRLQDFAECLKSFTEEEAPGNKGRDARHRGKRRSA
jgi:predicted ATP-dependent protease